MRKFAIAFYLSTTHFIHCLLINFWSGSMFEKRTNLIKLIPLVGVYNRVDDIDFDKLPSKFVLKCNHDSGSAVICTDKTNIDPAKVKSKLKLSLKKEYVLYDPRMAV